MTLRRRFSAAILIVIVFAIAVLTAIALTTLVDRTARG